MNGGIGGFVRNLADTLPPCPSCGDAFVGAKRLAGDGGVVRVGVAFDVVLAWLV